MHGIEDEGPDKFDAGEVLCTNSGQFQATSPPHPKSWFIKGSIPKWLLDLGFGGKFKLGPYVTSTFPSIWVFSAEGTVWSRAASATCGQEQPGRGEVSGGSLIWWFSGLLLRNLN